MALYGYDENEHLKIEAEAIDKDGFHKKVEVSSGSGSSSGEIFEENVYFGGFFNDMDMDAFVTVCINELTRGYIFENQPTILSAYLYFGDEIPNEELVIDENYLLNDDRLILFDGISWNHNFPINSGSYRIYSNDIDTENHPYPENWKNLQAHVVFVISYWDIRLLKHVVLQIHQK